MTSHELARKLLALPDLPIYSEAGEYAADQFRALYHCPPEPRDNQPERYELETTVDWPGPNARPNLFD